MKNIVRYGLYAIVILYAANFLALIVHSTYLGGDALNGLVKDGHFFVGSHGHYTEVTEAAFEFSGLHAKSIFYMLPFVFLAAFLLNVDKGQKSN